MRSKTPYKRVPRTLTAAAIGGLLFLHLPLALILLYAFSTEEASYQFPPPGLTTRWFEVAWERQDIWDAMGLSLRVAAASTALAIILGTLAAAAMSCTLYDHWLPMLSMVPVWRRANSPTSGSSSSAYVLSTTAVAVPPIS